MNTKTGFIIISCLALSSLFVISTTIQKTENNSAQLTNAEVNKGQLLEKKSSAVLAQAETSKTVDNKQSIPAKPLWQLADSIPKSSQTLAAEIPVEHITVSADAFSHLTVGQKVSLYIPQENKDYIGTVTENYQQFKGKVKISSGEIDNGSQFSSFTVTQGSESTLVMIATNESVYQVEIDNSTGNGTVIDDRALDYYRKHDDSLHTPPEGIS